MRLTALQGAAVNLDLFVIAEAQAVAKGYRLKKRYCNIFDYKAIPSWGRNTSVTDYGFVGRKYFGRNREIGHPDAVKIMWNGSVLTKLVGKVKPKSMKKDMYFKFKNAVPYRTVSYTIEGAQDLFYVLGIAVFMFGFPFLVGWDQRTGEKLLLLFFISINLMTWPHELLGKKIETLDMNSAWPNYVGSAYSAVSDVESDQDTTDEELLDQLKEDEELINPFTQKVAVLEDSPGNITVIREDGIITGINVYRWDGSVIYIPLKL
jgi:hypothetical protein